MNNDQQLAYTFFRNHPLMTVATVNGAGKPQTAVVYVHVSDNMDCYFATKTSTRKFENVRNDSHAVLSTYDENLLMFGELSGNVAEVQDQTEIDQLQVELKKILESRKSAYWVPPVAQLEGEGFVFLKLIPREVIYINYEQSSSENPQPHKISFTLPS